MKSKEKKEQNTQTEETKSFALLSGDQTDNKHSNSNEELIKREDVENTPFQVITIGKDSFGTFGKYKITEDYENPLQVHAELKKMDWNRVIQIMVLVIDMLRTKN